MEKKRKDLGQGPNPFDNNRLSTSFPRQSKNTKFLAQKKKIFSAWWGPPKTMLEISAITGIERASVCWFAREFRNNNSIRLVYTGICSVSLHRAGRYSTNPIYWKRPKKEVQDV